TLRRVGKPAGIMIVDVAAAEEWLREGITFAGVGVDSSLLVRAAGDLLARFREHSPAERSPAAVSAY
ncbi:MAG TPA: hypothetical protein VK083_09225, partial [Nocardia sp.]